jgi:ribonuclease Z
MASITFLGTGASVVTRSRKCSGILFEDKLIDVGFGVLANLLQSRTRLDSINEVYISHTHSDHIGDFTGLIWAMAMENRTKTVRVVSSASTAETLAKILDLHSTPWPWLKFKIDFVRPEEVRLAYSKTIHDPETLAFRFETSKGDVVYGADTAKSGRLARFCAGCELLIHDATFLDGQESTAALTNHSTARDAGSIAHEAKIGRLVLTHISPGNEGADKSYISQAASVFGGQIVVAKDHETIVL